MKRVALVTGAGSGIGAAIVRTLAGNGYTKGYTKIHAVDVGFDSECSDDRVVRHHLDLRDDQRLAQLFADIADDDDGLQALVNNAGVLVRAPIEQLTAEQWEQTFSVNLRAMFRCAQLALPILARTTGAVIVNISSVGGVRAGVDRVAYGTSKAGVIGLTHQLALELGPKGIRVNCVAPGAIETPMTAAQHDGATRRFFERVLPLRRYGAPSEVASVVGFLCDEASSYVSGAVLPVDGGYLASGLTP